jgi:hypothetical protein
MIEQIASVNEKQEIIRLGTPLGNINNLITMGYLKIYTSKTLIVRSIRQY